MSDERDRGLEPDDVFEELEVILGGDEKDKLFEVFLSLRSAIAMGVYLDAPRSWVLLQKTKPKKSVEEEARIQELFRCLLGDSVINQVEDPNVLLDSTIKPDTILGKPEEEGILWMLADKFPTVREVIDCMGELRDRLNEPYKVNISYRELDALGHSVLREIYRGEEYTSNPSSDEPSFIHEAYQNIRSNDAKLNRSLIKAFFELKHSFVDSGGIDPKEISEALEKKLNNLSTDS